MFYGKHTKYAQQSVTLAKAAVQKSAEDTLIGAELVQKMLWLARFKIKRAFRILRVLKKQSDIILYGFGFALLL